jgi:hypothetical protein
MPDNTPFIVGAFAVTWVTFIGYVVHLYRVRRDAQRQFDEATRDAASPQGGR